MIELVAVSKILKFEDFLGIVNKKKVLAVLTIVTDVTFLCQVYDDGENWSWIIKRSRKDCEVIRDERHHTQIFGLLNFSACWTLNPLIFCYASPRVIAYSY